MELLEFPSEFLPQLSDRLMELEDLNFIILDQQLKFPLKFDPRTTRVVEDSIDDLETIIYVELHRELIRTIQNGKTKEE